MYYRGSLHKYIIIIFIILTIIVSPILISTTAEGSTYREVSTDKLTNELLQPKVSQFVYSDIKGHWAEQYMSELSYMEILNGFVDNTMKPNKAITRSEFITMVVRVMNLKKVSQRYSYYFDMPTTHWAYDYVDKAKAYGLLDDFKETRLYPDQIITREEMAVIISRALPVGYEVDKPISFNDIKSDYANKSSIDRVSSAGIINGLPDGTFLPKGNSSRAEAAAIIIRLINLNRQEENLPDSFVKNYETSLISAANSTDITLDGIIEHSIGKEKALNEKRKTILKNIENTNTSIRRTISEIEIHVLQNSLYKSVVEIGYILTVENGAFEKNEYSIRKNMSITKRDGRYVVFDSSLDYKILGGQEPGQKINLTWQYIYKNTPDMVGQKKIIGLNVVSPTWFALKDESVNIIDKGDINYIKWAHENGYEVWPLFGNGFNADLTGKILRDAQKRTKLIDSIIQYSLKYNTDGINIDFENMKTADRDFFTLFIKELSYKAKAKDLIVSVDVTIINPYSNWSNCYDREDLSMYADYIILMGYDQHWEGSPKSGSVAQLSWVEDNLRKVLEEVPQEKLILGIPFYTRLWKEVYENGRTVVTSQALSMEAGQKAVKDNNAVKIWDEKSGQYYAEFKKDGALYRIWLEDENSIRLKAQLASKYNLAGLASWRKDFEKPAVWEVIDSVLNAASL